jgi:hypothetical protein
MLETWKKARATYVLHPPGVQIGHLPNVNINVNMQVAEQCFKIEAMKYVLVGLYAAKKKRLKISSVRKSGLGLTKRLESI